jgi:3-oxoacyl-[acyl-carrier-protein] synthase-3
MSSSRSAYVRGTGSYVPKRVLHNDDFTHTLDTSDEWIRTRTGIRERRIAAPDDNPASMGIAASRRALEAAGMSAADLDLIVCATATPALTCPSTACNIQAGLGCRPIIAFDVLAACSGFIYALAVADQFVRGGMARHALVVGSEVMSRITDFKERSSCILFGDGAGAAVLSAREQGPGGTVHWARLFADGAAGDFIRVPGNTHHTPFFPPNEPIHDFITLHGREVYRFAVTRMVELMREGIETCRAAGSEVHLVVPHQVNQRIIDRALSETGYPAEKVVINIDRYGNTAAASVPIALDEAVRDGRARPGDNVLLVAFGGGLTWSSALLTL